LVNKTIKKGERGINYLKTIVDQYECFFHKNDQENDVGLDCFIEFTKNGDETGKIVAIQVKNGSSYNTEEICKFPIDGHERYWTKCVVPVYGVVMNEDDSKNIISACWVDIKTFLKENSEKNMIIYSKALCNKLTRDEFEKFFCEIILNGCPYVGEETLLNLLNSKINLDVEYAIKAIDFNIIRNPVLTRKLISIISSTSNRSVIHDILKCLINFPDNEIEKSNLLPMLNISHVLECIGEEDYSLLCPFFIKDINSISYILNNIISISNPERRFQLEEIVSEVIFKQYNRFYNEEKYWKNVLLVLSNGLIEAFFRLFSEVETSTNRITMITLLDNIANYITLNDLRDSKEDSLDYPRLKGLYRECCLYVHGNINAKYSLIEFYNELLNEEITSAQKRKMSNDIKFLASILTNISCYRYSITLNDVFFRGKNKLGFLIGRGILC
jgi:hypothetical protein